jgi:hypothetical protein
MWYDSTAHLADIGGVGDGRAYVDQYKLAHVEAVL